MRDKWSGLCVDGPRAGEWVTMRQPFHDAFVPHRAPFELRYDIVKSHEIDAIRYQHVDGIRFFTDNRNTALHVDFWVSEENISKANHTILGEIISEWAKFKREQQ